ncbi:MAG: hypothetical protein HRT72_07955 [Flavobacteriales bacterium]|nr:hypothetical protein [Flavobacteriales bacterium]
MRLFLIALSVVAINTSLYSQNVAKNHFLGSYKFCSGIGLQYDFNSVYLDRLLYSIDVEFSHNTPLFMHTTDFSTSITSHLSMLAHPNFKDIKSSFTYVVAPVFFEMNIGHIATKSFFNDSGFSLGAGYGANFKNIEINHGMSFTLAVRSWTKRRSITTRYIILLGDNFGYHTLTLMINRGRYIEHVKGLNKVSRFTKGEY